MTFEEQFIPLWEAFVAFSQNKDKTDEAVIQAEEDFDKAVEDLAVGFSHPPGRPNRRRAS